jgi:hypothetical protein
VGVAMLVSEIGLSFSGVALLSGKLKEDERRFIHVVQS